MREEKKHTTKMKNFQTGIIARNLVIPKEYEKKVVEWISYVHR